MSRYFFFIVLLLYAISFKGQVSKDGFNGSRQKVDGGVLSSFNQGRVDNFNAYRQKLNATYISKTKEKWKSFNSNRLLVVPDDKIRPVDPVFMSEEDSRLEKKDKQLVIENIIKPLGDRTPPKPIVHFQEALDNSQQNVTFEFLGTTLHVRMPKNVSISLPTISESTVAAAWSQLCTECYNSLIVDCIQLRSSLKLCDWAYLMMLKELGNRCLGPNSNEATLLMAYIFSQSGYKIRLGNYNGRLEMLYASQHHVYNTPYYTCDGDNFYAMSGDIGNIEICAAKYPKEQSLSLWIRNCPEVSFLASDTRVLTSKRYPEISVRTCVNKNLLPFYTSYPVSEVGGNFMTRWAMYANTPMCQEIKDELYPLLLALIGGHTQLEAVERLLNWVQTAFVYEYPKIRSLLFQPYL